MGRDGRNEGWATATTITVITLGVLVLGGAGLVAACAYVLGPREVGPDADEMADDPVLHIELPQATAGDVIADTGTEGGLTVMVPAADAHVSKASRRWESDTGDWVGLLIDMLVAVGSHDVTWRHLRCDHNSASVSGRKDVEVHDEPVEADLTIYLSDAVLPDEPVRLSIELSSDGRTLSEGNGAWTALVEGACPDHLRTTFERLHATP